MSTNGTYVDSRDGYSYQTVQLRDGSWWLGENLRYDIAGSFPADRQPRPEVLAKHPDYDWEKYGRLYTWEGAKKACPPGWHVPSDREWEKVSEDYGFSRDENYSSDDPPNGQ